MTYLHQDDSAFRADPALRSLALDALLTRAFESAKSFVVEFERADVERIIGPAIFELMPDLAPIDATGSNVPYTVYRGTLNRSGATLLHAALMGENRQWPEAVTGYIESARLMDESGKTILRISDAGATVLFALAADDRKILMEDYSRLGVPVSAIEELDTDIEALKP